MDWENLTHEDREKIAREWAEKVYHDERYKNYHGQHIARATLYEFLKEFIVKPRTVEPTAEPE